MKNNFSIHLLLFNLLFLTAYTQNQTYLHKTYTYDQLKAKAFDNSLNETERLKFTRAYLKKAVIEKSSFRIARGYYLLGYKNYGKNDNLALKFLDSSIMISRKTPDTLFPAVAYREKAEILVRKRKFKEGVYNFKKAESYALKNNFDYYILIRDAIATVKSENLGEINEALDIYKECFNYYKTNTSSRNKHPETYLNVIFGLADVYKSLKISDSSSYYNKLGFEFASKNNNKEYVSIFILNEAAVLTFNGEYNEAIKKIKIAFPELIKNKDMGNILASYFYLGLCYEGLKKDKLALTNYKKVDSIYIIRKKITPEFVGGYKFLINYYKNLGDEKNQLKYITTLMEIDSVFQSDYKNLYKTFLKDYDIPRFLKEKENKYSNLKEKHNLLIIVLVTTLIILSVMIYRQQMMRSIYKKRFDSLLSNNKDKNEQFKINVLNEKENASKEIGISDEVVKNILDKLKKFENKKDYLQSSLTIQIISEQFNTNTKYLSKIVNIHKGKSFVNYVNDLRIDYAIESLKKNKKLRKYTQQALSNEFGFKTTESFTSAFYKKTGIKVSYFLKELDNQEKT